MPPRSSAQAGQAVLTDAGNGGHILEMRLFRLSGSAFLMLESLKKFEQNFLRDLTPSSFQVGKPRESEISIQIVGSRVEWAPHGHVAWFFLFSRHGAVFCCSSVETWLSLVVYTTLVAVTTNETVL